MSSDLDLFAINCDAGEVQAGSSLCEQASDEKHQRNVEWASELWSLVSNGRMSSVRGDP